MADKREAKGAIEFECPACGARPGERCTNYKKKACAPHRERLQLAYPSAAPGRAQLQKKRRGPGPAWQQGELFPGGESCY